MSDSNLKVSILLGSKRLVGFYKQEGKDMVYMSYSISYDQAGKEMSRTTPEAISRLSLR